MNKKIKTKAEVVEEYIKYRRLRNHTSSVNDIKFHIKKFINSTKKSLDDFDDEVLLNYMDKITPKYSISMLNNIKSSYIKNFIKWYYIDWSSRFKNLDIMCKTEKVGETYNAEDMISEDDFKKIIKREESHFWKAYFLTLFYGCCRPTEVCHLTKDMIEFDDDGAFITIYSKKNKTSFIKFVPSDVAFYLKEMINLDHNFMFYNEKTKLPITVKAAYWRIKKLSEGKLDLYTLRHSIATINYGKDIKDDYIARQMGHSQSMKKKYEHNDKEKLKERAKSIYIIPEDLPPAERLTLKKRVEEIEKKDEKNAKIMMMLLDILKDNKQIAKKNINKIKQIAEQNELLFNK